MKRKEGMMIDLRSDTLTHPTAEMRKAMYEAKVGDDGRVDQEGHGEDPTVNELQEEAARIFGKEDALLASSGTMGNLVALLTHCQPGDRVIVGENAHIHRIEKAGFNPRFGGASAVVVECDRFGKMKMESLASMITDDIKLLCLENTNNFYSGTFLTQEEIERYTQAAHARGIPVHMDCARIFNAAIAQKVDVKSLTGSVDSLMFCISKGLSCPVGSLLVGSKDFIRQARENRKMIGGEMRQAGVFAAAGIVALKKMINRLEEDHATAQKLAAILSGIKGLSLDLELVQTNIVRFDVSSLGLSSSQFAGEVGKRGVKLGPVTDILIRAVTHRGIRMRDVEKAGKIIHDFCRDQKMARST